MAYAHGRTFFDADSHVMELRNFLLDHADPQHRDRIPPLSVSSGARVLPRRARAGSLTEEKRTWTT